MEQTTNQSEKKPFTVAWVSSTYFAEGLPFMIVRIISSVFFTDIGARERYIGYLNLLNIPWNIKFLWSPLLDTVSTKRRWQIVLQSIIAALTLAIALACYFVPQDSDPSRYLIFIAVVFVVMAFCSATNDIAIDGYYMEGLTDRREQAAYSGYRVLAYRVAMIFARSGLVAFAAYIAAKLGSTNKYLPWVYAFGAGAATMFLVAGLHAVYLPHFEAERKAKTAGEILAGFRNAFITYLQQEKVVLVLIFIVIYKLGDEVLFSMVTPFLMRELGISKAQYAWVGGIVGAAGTVVGAMLGGWWIKKQGLKKAIWPLTLLMNFNIWAYIWLAWAKPDPKTVTGISIIAFIHGYEQVAAGLGSAALLVYLLGTCKPDYKAAHYAIGSAIMSLGGTIFGGYGGVLVEKIGYLNLFLLAFFISIPSMVMLFFVPLKDDAPKS
ncbi:MAG: MFS transporter [Acidobacteriota bacterium]|nr:MFS transporter [Blastocatellia bacterium]MDW8411798.1 MFS transporter [Acidobacteriota bacterium]